MCHEQNEIPPLSNDFLCLIILFLEMYRTLKITTGSELTFPSDQGKDDYPQRYYLRVRFVVTGIDRIN